MQVVSTFHGQHDCLLEQMASPSLDTQEQTLLSAKSMTTDTGAGTR